jgi:anti-sigma factor RsiW
MTGDHTDFEIEELLGAYALDAVDEDERQLIERHLAECPRCRLEVEEHREVAAQLAYVGAPAPEGVWDRVVASLEDAPPALDLAPVVVLPARPSIGRRAALVGAVLGAVAAAVIAVLGVQVSRLDHRVAALDADRRQGIAQAINAAFLTPGATRVSLKGAGGVEAVLLPDGTGYVVRSSLPALSDGRTYQLWAIGGRGPISLGVLGGRPAPMEFQIVANDVSALAVTNEAAGGAPSPTLPPVAIGYVSRA